jgi:hypothetical protein
LVDAAANQEDEKNGNEDAYDRGDDYDDEEPNALNHTDSGADEARENDDVEGANPGVDKDTDAEENTLPFDLTNPDPNLSNDEYKARLANLVQQQQEKDARVAKRKEREREKMRTEELVKAGGNAQKRWSWASAKAFRRVTAGADIICLGRRVGRGAAHEQQKSEVYEHSCSASATTAATTSRNAAGFFERTTSPWARFV